MILKNLFSLSTLTLLTAFTLSGIAAWYSILGLVAIFSGAVVPIIVMGGSLEFGKVVATMWLQRYWHKCGFMFKLYLVPAVLALAFLTSMGIFGFLSKAHIDQGIPTGDVASKIAIIDERIKTERENIAASRQALAQMNAQVDQRLARGETEKGAERAIQVRRQQAAERNKLAKEIETAQQRISALNEERAPIASQLRRVEAEVGPIKYIAALIYGDNPDQTILERAVRWVIILIVFVFDPLALMLVLAANASRQWNKEDEAPVVPISVPVTEKKNIVVLPEVTQPPPPMPPVKAPKPEPVAVPSVQKEVREVLPAIEPVVEKTTPSPEPIVLKGQGEQEVEDGKAKLENLAASAPDIVVTEGVTKELPFIDNGGDYVISNGKQVHREALKQMHPEFFMGLTADSATHSKSNFGTSFPKLANKGDTFVRVDQLPNKVYKFDGVRWIELVKSESIDSLNDEYIQYLIAQIDSGAYPVDLLTEREKSRIEEYLKK
jgi:hypothetical protein